jgi:Leucine-rich repeat (LRR) protein
MTTLLSTFPEMSDKAFFLFLGTADNLKEERIQSLLRGTLPPEIAFLTEVQQFVVGDQKLEGPIDGIFSTWSKLRRLDLSLNKFTGTIPATLATNSPDLRSIELNDNSFAGEIPPSIGNLTNLGVLSLGSNTLNGTLPESFGLLVNLSKCVRLTGFKPPPYTHTHTHTHIF